MRSSLRLRLLLPVIATMLFSLPVFSQTSLPLNTIVTENFNAIGASATATLPSNWRMSPSGNAVGAWSAGVSTTTQAASSGTPSAGGRYNWATTAGSDRAIGFLTDGAYASPNAVMAHYRNTTGGSVSSVTVAYALERYLINATVPTVDLYYSTDGTAWTLVSGASTTVSDFPTGAAAGSFAAPKTINKTATVNVSLSNNSDIYFRWVFTTGNTGSQGLGLDNVSVFAGTATPVLIATLKDILQTDGGTAGQFNEGDVIRYETKIKNVGTGDAQNVQINIPPPSNTTLVPGSIKTSAVAVDDNYTTSFNTALNGSTVLANDFGTPAPTAVLTYGPTANNAAFAAGSGGTTDAGGTIMLQSNGTFTYTPPTGFSGVDKFAYVTGNGNLPNNDAIVSITVWPDLTFTTTPADPSCNGGSNGSITFNANGGNGALQYSITGSAGTYQSSNVFSGLAAGTYNAAVKDASGLIKTGTVTLNNPAAIVVSISGFIPLFPYNVAIPSGTFTKTGGTGSITWSATGLPPGITVNSSTGVISGTPTQTGTFNAVISATDVNSCTGTLNITFSIVANLMYDSYNVVGNTQLVVAGHSSPATPHTTSTTNILANDVSDAPIVITAVNDAATNNGGRITISADGKFTYTPPVGYTGADYYAYTGTTNGVSDTATINFTITNMVWYVNNAYAGANGAADGRSHRPFTTTTPAATASATNQIIYVHTGSGNTTGNTVLKSGQTLRGAGNALNVGTLSIAAGTKPTLSGTITLANNVTVDGFDMNTGTSAAITNAAATVTGINVDLGNMTTTTGTAVSVTGTSNTGTMTFASVTTGAAVNGVNVTNFASPGYVYINGGTITNTTGTGMNFSSVGTVILKGVTINETTQTALAISATPVILDGSLTIATSGGGTGISIGAGTSSFSASNYAFRITNTGSGQGLVSSGATFSFISSNSIISTQTGTALNLSNTIVHSNGITFTSVSSNGAANGINLTNVTGTGNVYVAVGTLAGGAGAVVNINGGSAPFYYGGSITQATALQPMVSISGGHSGNVTFSNNLSATNGTGLQFDNADGTYNFNGITSLNGGDAGLDILNGSGGTFNFGTNFGSDFSIVNPTGIAININGSTANVNYGGSFFKNNNATTGISITNNTGGTITINGTGTKTLSTQTANAINLTSNPGVTINFSGNNLLLTTTSGVGFNATGGGTVSVAGTGNTITSTTGTALNVANTTIGGTGLTFRSISVNGASKGIALNNTGSGALIVTGTGTTAGSGGTIQNISARGVEIISSSNISLANMNFTNANTVDAVPANSNLSVGGNLSDNAAIYLNNVNTITIDRIAISGTTAEHGINGHTVNNFTLSNSSIVNAGNESDEDGIHFYNMSGTSAITNTTINSTVVTPNTTGGDDHLNLQMQSGTLILTISGGSVTNANKGSGYLFGIRGTANATINISGVSSTGNFSGGIVADAYDNSTMNLNVTGSTSSGNNDQLSVSAGDNSKVKLNATSNTISSVATGDFVGIGLLGSALDNGFTFDATISNNNITIANGLAADAIVVNNAGGGLMRTAITNNTIEYSGTQRAMLIQGGTDGAAQMQVTITGNTVDIKLDGTGNAAAGILAQAAVTSPTGNNSSICVDIGGAGALRNTFTHSSGGTIAAGDIRVRQRFVSTVKLPGYAGSTSDNTAVANYLAARNTVVSAPTATNEVGVTVGAGGFVGGSACTQPQ